MPDQRSRTSIEAMVYPLQDRYISLLTDFGFKHIFGTEPNKRLLIDFLNTILPDHHHIQDLSFKNTEQLGGKTLQEGIFPDLFEAAEIANFSSTEQESYQNSLKYYRDMNNVVDTARQEGRQEGKQEGKQEGIQEGIEQERSRILERQRSIVLKLLSRTLGELPDSVVMQIHQLSIDQLEKLNEEFVELNHLDDLVDWLDQTEN
jgi:PD-(D/E)XK nuclease family transposase/Domain of unknown function (DUF4351)